MNELIKKWNLTRTNIELISAIFIISCSLTILLVVFKYKTSLTYDHGKIAYRGDVVNHRMNGYGKLTYKNGDSYEGYFNNGVFEGKGTFKSKDGWTYVGDFKDGQADGKGKLTTDKKGVYSGTFKKGIYQQ